MIINILVTRDELDEIGLTPEGLEGQVLAQLENLCPGQTDLPGFNLHITIVKEAL